MADAVVVREEGNALYKAGKLLQAREKYEEAAKLAPDDPAPLSNLSAVHFELGEYSVAAEHCRRAVSLTATTDGSTHSKRQALLSRLAKSLLFSLQLKEASEVLPELDSKSEVNAGLAQSVNDLLEAQKKCEGKSRPTLWGALLDRVPRRKVSLLDSPGWFPFGHDALEGLPREVTGSEFSFIFCGSGDSRNVIPALSELGSAQEDGKCSGHITMVDVNSAAIARALIIWHGLLSFRTNAIIHNDDATAAGGRFYTLAISYMFAGTVMPPKVHGFLCDHLIPCLIEDLQDPESLSHRGLHVSRDGVPAIVKHLKRWIRDPPSELPASRVRKEGKKLSCPTKFGRDGPPGPKDRFGWFMEDCQIFDQFGIIPPSKGYREAVEPELHKLLNQFLARPTSKKAIQNVEGYLDANWRVNLTAFDFDWHAAKGKLDLDGDDWMFATLEVDAPMACARLAGPEKDFDAEGKGLSASMQEPFVYSGQVSMNGVIDGLTHFEFIIGDMGDFMDHLARDSLPHRLQQTAAPLGRKKCKFPKVYDVVHLSNVPDYTGGHFSAFLDVYPILRDGKSTVQFTCLLNPPLWKTHEDFNAEYSLLPDSAKFSRHLGMRRTTAGCPPGMPVFLYADYWTWQKDETVSKKGMKGLMPRSRLERWLHAHFLKMALPAYRPHSSLAPVMAPLHFMTLLRLVEHAHHIGYPSHWLSAVLDQLCSGTIKTTARAPHTFAMDPVEADAVHGTREMDVSQWSAEFTTIVALWRHLLPFGLLTVTPLPPLDSISEYQVRFKKHLPDVAKLSVHFPHFCLAFWSSAAGNPPEKQIREFLIDDERGSVSHAQKTKLRGLGHIVMAFRYSTDKKTATFWLRDDVVDSMMASGEWKSQIWRTDTWVAQSGVVSVIETIKKLRSWTI